MEHTSTSASIVHLVFLTIGVGVVAGVVTGLTLQMFLGPEDRTLRVALTASITTAITSAVVSSRMHALTSR